MENKIEKLEAEEIFDSRGNPTIKVTAFSGRYSGSFSVPSGASTGAHEAHELRDKDKKGVTDAVGKINDIIAKALVGMDPRDQRGIDELMIKLDGTPNKVNLGGNSTIGVSIACAKLAASLSGLETFEYLRSLSSIKPSREVPYLYMNLINGGKHAKSHLAFQEYHIIPNTLDIQDSVAIGIKIQRLLEEIILKNLDKNSLSLGDEGGFAPKITDIRTPLVYLTEAIEKAGLTGKIKLALDVAASSFYSVESSNSTQGTYKVDEKEISKENLAQVYDELVKEFGLLSIEDPFEEEDFESFTNLRELHPKLIVVGDDLTVTNKVLLQKAIDRKSVSGLIIKPNQIGTLTETLETMKLARENNVELIISHRSGETSDDFIADLAYAFGCFGLKSGSPMNYERMVKYQRLIRISKK